MSDKLAQFVGELRSVDHKQRAAAAEALCRLGGDAPCAAVALVRACGDETEEVCQWVGEALENLGPPAASDAAELADLISADSDDVAYWAVSLLGRLGEEARVALPALARALETHASAAVRQRAAWALGNLGPAAAGALAPLKTAAASDDARLARLAKQAIERLGGTP